MSWPPILYLFFTFVFLCLYRDCFLLFLVRFCRGAEIIGTSASLHTSIDKTFCVLSYCVITCSIITILVTFRVDIGCDREVPSRNRSVNFNCFCFHFVFVSSSCFRFWLSLFFCIVWCICCTNHIFSNVIIAFYFELSYLDMYSLFPSQHIVYRRPTEERIRLVKEVSISV